MLQFTLIFTCLGAALVLAAPNGFRSPCPELFQYKTEHNEPGHWEGTLTLISDADLHGAWIRLIFDSKISELTVSDKEYQVVHDSQEALGVLVKNRNALLKDKVPKILDITVKYQGDKVPQLIGFRLNAKIVCPVRNSDNGVFYRGDANSADFLLSILSNLKSTASKIDNKNCGIAPLADRNVADNFKATESQWPWQAAVFAEKEQKNTFLCEATLISENALLTSAHCVTWENTEVPLPAILLSVRLGDLRPIHDSKTHRYSAKNVIVHPGYNVRSLQNDLAIIKLENSVQVNDKLRPVCLPSKETERKESIVVGYGFGAKEHLQNLESAKIRSLTDDDCVKHEPSFAPLIGDNEFCAAYLQDHHNCVGSSGSGVVTPRDGKDTVWELTGIVNLGRALLESHNCKKDAPILLSKVSHYLKWIRASVL